MSFKYCIIGDRRVFRVAENVKHLVGICMHGKESEI